MQRNDTSFSFYTNRQHDLHRLLLSPTEDNISEYYAHIFTSLCLARSPDRNGNGVCINGQRGVGYIGIDRPSDHVRSEDTFDHFSQMPYDPEDILT